LGTHVNLVEQWQKGEAAAFERLFLQYKDMVLRTALSMNGDGHEAEDIMQMAFIRAYQSRSKFNGDDNAFKRWLYRITINLCVDVHRKKRSYLSLEQLKEKGFEHGNQSSHSKMEAKDIVWQMMDCLDNKHRSVVVLRYLHEMPYEEISETLGIPLGTVKSRLNTAMRMMRRKLVKAEGGN